MKRLTHAVQHRARRSGAGALAGLCLLAQLASLISCGPRGGGLPPDALHPPAPPAWRKVRLHRFAPAASRASAPTALSLADQARLPLVELARRYSTAAGLSPAYALQAEGDDEPAAGSIKALEQVEAGLYQLFWQGTLICRSYLKLQRLRDGSPLLSGELPLAAPLPPSASPLWPSKADAWQKILEAHPGMGNGTPVAGKATPCYLWQDEQWRPAWEFAYTAHEPSLPYLAYADAGLVYKKERRFAPVSAVLSAYKSNPRDGVLTQQTLELTGDGTLTSNLFVSQPRGVARAQHADHRFIVATDDPTFAEITSYAAINRMYDWLHNYGYTWKGAALTLKIHELVKVGVDESGNDVTSVNNAFSSPASGGNAAYILLGDGDGENLQNLALDADIVAHEFSHQLVFTSLTSTDMQEDRSQPVENHEHSGAIHEGLADFLAYASTGNACLGESVCPTGSGFCYQPEACLRTGDLALTYGSEEYWTYEGFPHLKGQVVAALLWDLRRAAGTKTASFDELVVQSIGFLSPRSSYEDLLVALLTADYEFHDSHFACSIASAAELRGFGREMAAITDDCTRFVPSGAAGDEDDEEGVGGDDTPVIEVKTAPRGSELKRHNCGVIAAPLAGQGPPLAGGGSLVLLGLLALLPLLAAGLDLYRKAP